MIQVTSVQMTDGVGQPIPDSTETFPDLEAVRNELAGSAEDDYAERVLSGLKDASEVTVPNGPGVLDVWSVIP